MRLGDLGNEGEPRATIPDGAKDGVGKCVILWIAWSCDNRNAWKSGDALAQFYLDAIDPDFFWRRGNNRPGPVRKSRW